MIIHDLGQIYLNPKKSFSLKELHHFSLLDEANLTPAYPIDLKLFVLNNGVMAHDPMQWNEQVQYKNFLVEIIL